MEEGDKVVILEGNGNPFKGPDRGVAIALLACGAKFYNEKEPLWDWVEEGPDGTVSRKHRWLLAAEAPLKFTPNFKAETISADEARKRFNDPEWCLKNPSHPIASMRHFWDQLVIFTERAATWKPAKKVSNKRGDVVFIGPNMSPEDQAIELAKLES